MMNSITLKKIYLIFFAVALTGCMGSGDVEEESVSPQESSSNPSSPTSRNRFNRSSSGDLDPSLRAGLESLELRFDEQQSRVHYTFSFPPCDNCYDTIYILRSLDDEDVEFATIRDPSVRSYSKSFDLGEASVAKFKLKICVDGNCYKSKQAVSFTIDSEAISDYTGLDQLVINKRKG